MSYNVNVQVATTDTPLAAGVTFDHTALAVTDSAGVVQTFALVAPFTQAVTVAADGPSNYSAQAMDSTGAPIGSAVTTTFTPAVVQTFPAPSAITVTAA